MGVITNMGELTGFDYKSKESKNSPECYVFSCDLPVNVDFIGLLC